MEFCTASVSRLKKTETLLVKRVFFSDHLSQMEGTLLAQEWSAVRSLAAEQLSWLLLFVVCL